jgi:hypothetical protein
MVPGNAFIYHPEGERHARWVNDSIAHCDRRRYDWSLIHGDVDRVGHLLCANGGGIVVVARAEHFQPLWLPRIEVVGDETRRITRGLQVRANAAPNARNAPRGRRPNIIR